MLTRIGFSWTLDRHPLYSYINGVYAMAIVPVLSILVLILVYALIVYLYKKITLYEYFYELNFSLNTKLILENPHIDTSNLLVVSLPGTSIVHILKDNILLKGFEEDKSDPNLVEEKIQHLVFTNKKKDALQLGEIPTIIVLPFFDIKCETLESFNKKLNMLEGFFNDKTKKVVWISTYDPLELIEVLRKKAFNSQSQRIKEKDNSFNFYVESQSYDKLLLILDDFHKINYPLEQNEAFLLENDDLKYTLSLLRTELSHSLFLQNLAKTFLNDHFTQIKTKNGIFNLRTFNGTEEQLYNENKNFDEIMILKIQDLAKNYYYSIWSCLNSKEKYVLYDLAKDELTNFRNLPLLNQLLEKGVLVFDQEKNNIKIFNKSFRNFILTTIDPAEALLLEKEINIVGTWEVTRMILFIVFISFGAFMFFTQQAFFNKMFGLATTLTSLIPFVINFLSSAKDNKVGK
jgi:hypothetical protein